MEKKTVIIPGISCGHCVMTIKNELLEIAGVQTVDGDPETKTVVIGWNPPATWETIAGILDEIGYLPSPEP